MLLLDADVAFLWYTTFELFVEMVGYRYQIHKENKIYACDQVISVQKMSQ